jgi:hypothetical protein
MSYIVVTDTFATIRDVVGAVAVSTMASDIELIIVCPSNEAAPRAVGIRTTSFIENANPKRALVGRV